MSCSSKAATRGRGDPGGRRHRHTWLRIQREVLPDSWNPASA
jgi:hypothetical protein